MRHLRRLAGPLALLLLAGCALLPDPGEEAREMAAKGGRSWNIVEAGSFDLAVVPPAVPVPGGTLAVYLEGDGRAFVNGFPSTDPTPPEPEVLPMALAHPGGFSAYIARPCQYTMLDRGTDQGRNCGPTYWSDRRYAPEVVDSISAAVDWVKQRSGADRLILVGYSGGGAMAVLLAARRNDVAGIVTLAGDLDLAYWAQRDGLTPLAGSLDPVDAAPGLGAMPQLVFVGGKDETVEPDVDRAYFNRLPPGTPARMITIPRYTHYCCWTDDWRKIAARPEFALIPGWPGTGTQP